MGQEREGTWGFGKQGFLSGGRNCAVRSPIGHTVSSAHRVTVGEGSIYR